jgi:hypothetical protein
MVIGAAVVTAGGHALARITGRFLPRLAIVPEPVQQAAREETPPLDPHAIDRAYRLHRARRRARVEHRRQLRQAGMRFWLVLVVLLALSILLALTLWSEIEQLFGL